MLHFSTNQSRRDFIRRVSGAGITISALPLGRRLFGAESRPHPEAALAFPGPWQFMVPKGAIILVSDQQLEDLQDPDKEVDLSMSSSPHLTTLRKICEETKAQGSRTVILAFDDDPRRFGGAGVADDAFVDGQEFVILFVNCY